MTCSSSCSNVPDETPRMRAMQSAQTRQKRLEPTGRNHLFLLPSLGARSARPWPALIGWTVCRGSAFLQRTAPAFGPLVAHWAENDAYPYLAHSQSETLRDHIWNGIPFQRNSAHAAYQRARGECREQSVGVVKTKMGIVVVVLSDVKILSIK